MQLVHGYISKQHTGLWLAVFPPDTHKGKSCSIWETEPKDGHERPWGGIRVPSKVPAGHSHISSLVRTTTYSNWGSHCYPQPPGFGVAHFIVIVTWKYMLLSEFIFFLIISLIITFLRRSARESGKEWSSNKQVWVCIKILIGGDSMIISEESFEKKIDHIVQ